MPAVLVHGVADTHHVWDRVRAKLKRSDVVALALPGFNSPVPAGFGATKEAYVNWLVDQLQSIGEPVDLVGHDWGCMLTARVASLRPDLVRTLAGSNGPIDSDYDWHDVAKIWQTPGAGEQWMKDMDPATFEGLLVDSNMPADEARRCVMFFDDVMKDSILKLYRSATTVGKEWQAGLANIMSPAIIVWGLQDKALPHQISDRMAETMRADAVIKLRCGHWPILERPDDFARELEAHWARDPKRS